MSESELKCETKIGAIVTLKDKLRPMDKYLELRSGTQRQNFLREMKKENQSLPVSLVSDLLLIDIPMPEKVALIQVANSDDNLELELFFLRLLPQTHQDISVTALQQWAARTDHILWHKVIEIALLPHIPQRLRYRMLEVTPKAGGRFLVEAFARIEGLEDLSSAFHGLLIQRSLQWCFFHPRVTEIAIRNIETLLQDQQANEKGLPTALGYLARYAPEELRRIRISELTSESWRPILTSVYQYKFEDKDHKKLEMFLQKKPTKAFMEQFLEYWPCLWERGDLSENSIRLGMERIVQYMNANSITNNETYPMNWQAFAGIKESRICSALEGIEDDELFVCALNLLEGQVPFVLPKSLIDNVIHRLRKSKNPEHIIININSRIRYELSQLDNGGKDRTYLRVCKERKATIDLVSKEDGKPGFLEAVSFAEYPRTTSTVSDWTEEPKEFASRRKFFALSIFNENVPVSQSPDNFWEALIQAWHNPSTETLNALTPLARKAPAFFQVSYLMTLGHFRGNDEAALKLLDYIRTEEEHELRAVLYALHGIRTPRAIMELVSSLTRPNMNGSLQMEVAALLKDLELDSVQAELRSAIADLDPGPDTGEKWELKETLTALLTAPYTEDVSETSSNINDLISFNAKSKQDLDRWLNDKLTHYQEMSSEVKRALRTAEFFHKQVNASDTHSAIDLSPVIDMQYKAMELTFREMFEGPCKDLIHTGILQRKLDVIGYARPIEHAMTEFENYIGNLPVINTIPFFSKFKLRKMLRAICLFRPGRRFTLDGLKAFGLFFLCFGRKEDRFGLEGLFSLPFKNDLELYEFTKKLHMFQDIRNRAAHEGFQPDASNDIDSIWNLTAEIVNTAYAIKSTLKLGPKGSIGKKVQDSPLKGHKKAEGVKIVHKKVS